MEGSSTIYNSILPCLNLNYSTSNPISCKCTWEGKSKQSKFLGETEFLTLGTHLNSVDIWRVKLVHTGIFSLPLFVSLSLFSSLSLFPICLPLSLFPSLSQINHTVSKKQPQNYSKDLALASLSFLLSHDGILFCCPIFHLLGTKWFLNWFLISYFLVSTKHWILLNNS